MDLHALRNTVQQKFGAGLEPAGPLSEPETEAVCRMLVGLVQSDGMDIYARAHPQQWDTAEEVLHVVSALLGEELEALRQECEHRRVHDPDGWLPEVEQEFVCGQAPDQEGE